MNYFDYQRNKELENFNSYLLNHKKWFRNLAFTADEWKICYEDLQRVLNLMDIKEGFSDESKNFKILGRQFPKPTRGANLYYYRKMYLYLEWKLTFTKYD